MSRTDGVQAQFEMQNLTPQNAPDAALPTRIGARLAQVQTRIAAACRDAGRAPQSVQLIAVSKTCPANAVRAAHAAGQIFFGENYVQEGIKKINALTGLPLEWHFIGPLQTNKTRVVAEHFAWVHGIDRLKIAERLSANARPICNRSMSAFKSMSTARPAKVASRPLKLPGWRVRLPRCPI